MSRSIDALAWPADRLGEALVEVANGAGLRIDDTVDLGVPPIDPRRSIAWSQAAVAKLGAEAEVVSCAHRELDALLSSIGPALVPVADDAEAGLRFAAVLPGGGRRARVVAPDGAIHRVARSALADAVSAGLYRYLEAEGLPELLADAGIDEARRGQVLREVAGQRHAEVTMGPFVVLRPHPASSLWTLARHAGVPRTLLALIGAHLLSTGALGIAWFVLGRGALSGTLEPAWLAAWALAIASTVPLGALASWSQGRFAITAGRLLKERLMYGSLRLDPDSMRREGAGSLLGRVLESSAVESLFLGGSLAAVLSLVDLVFAGWVLSQGAGGTLTTVALVGYALLCVVAVWRFHRRNAEWTDQRLTMTHDLVERMVGHRTRLVQQTPERWHDDEDVGLESYLHRSERLDRSALTLSLLPRGWLVLGALAIGPAFVAGTDVAAVAIAIGGLLVSYRALAALASGLESLAQAGVAWRRVRPLFDAGSTRDAEGELEVRFVAGESEEREPRADQAILEARELSFRYPARERAVLDGCSLQVNAGDHVLLEGASGSGKSTMAMVLGGLREASAGLLLVDGLDKKSLGPAGWRSRVTTVPQFHENHVFSASFAFNALMGRAWPPRPGDLQELGEVCEELGLGPLLRRMPAHFEQTVGDQGWQLSHGERSRLLLARAMLQRDARVWILDESFGTLDPVTMRRCVDAVRRRAPSLLVIAHP